MSVTMSMLRIVEDHMARNNVTRLKRLNIKVGGLTAVEPEQLRFCFVVCTAGTPMEGAVLDIEEVPLAGRCTGCGAEFRMEYFLQSCPACDGPSVIKAAGDELEVVSMEAE